MSGYQKAPQSLQDPREGPDTQTAANSTVSINPASHGSGQPHGSALAYGSVPAGNQPWPGTQAPGTQYYQAYSPGHVDPRTTVPQYNALASMPSPSNPVQPSTGAYQHAQVSGAANVGPPTTPPLWQAVIPGDVPRVPNSPSTSSAMDYSPRSVRTSQSLVYENPEPSRQNLSSRHTAPTSPPNSSAMDYSPRSARTSHSLDHVNPQGSPSVRSSASGSQRPQRALTRAGYQFSVHTVSSNDPMSDISGSPQMQVVASGLNSQALNGSPSSSMSISEDVRQSGSSGRSDGQRAIQSVGAPPESPTRPRHYNTAQASAQGMVTSINPASYAAHTLHRQGISQASSRPMNSQHVMHAQQAVAQQFAQSYGTTFTSANQHAVHNPAGPLAQPVGNYQGYRVAHARLPSGDSGDEYQLDETGELTRSLWTRCKTCGLQIPTADKAMHQRLCRGRHQG